MVIVPSPGSIWDYPYLNQVTSMMGLVYGTRSKPEQDLFPSKIRIPEIHVISPLHPLSPFQHLGAFTSRPSIDYIFMRTMFLLFSLFLFFLLVSSILEKNFYDPRKKRSWNLITSFLPRIVSRAIHFPPLSSFFPSPFSRIGNSILEKAKNVVDKRPWERGTYVSLHNWIRLRNNR